LSCKYGIGRPERVAVRIEKAEVAYFSRTQLDDFPIGR
jgi:hypothetical protein